MLAAHKQIFRKLNLDLDPFFSKEDQYTFLKNAAPVQTGGENDGAIASVWGNTKLGPRVFGEFTDTIPPANGTNKIIGSFDDLVNNRVIYFNYNSLGSHGIYVVSGDLYIDVVKIWSGFNFSLIHPINGIAVLGDLVYWCDSNNEIRKINLSNPGVVVAEEDLTVIKRAPYTPLVVTLDNDGSYTQNYVRNTAFQFYYRYIYADNETSVFGATSKIIYPTTSYAYNRVKVVAAILSIPNSVIRVEFAYRIVNTQEWIVYKTQDVADFITDAGIHYFYNDTIGATVPDTESFKWFDSVPLNAKALEIIKNRLFLFNYLENYTKVTSDSLSIIKTNSSTATAQTIIEKVYTHGSGGNTTSYWWFDGTWYWRTTLQAVIIEGPFTAAQVATDNGDATVTAVLSTTNHAGVALAKDVQEQGFKSFSAYKAGVIFFDAYGRHIGVTTGPSATFQMGDPDYLSPPFNNLFFASHWRVSWDVSAVPIPTWATRYAIVRTKALDKSFFIQHQTADVWYYYYDVAGALVFTKDKPENAVGFAIDIGNLTKINIGYTFNAGDKIKIGLGILPQPWIEFDIDSQNGKFILVKDPIRFSHYLTNINIPNSAAYYYEIYTPIKGEQLFYEVGEKYAITNPGASASYSVPSGSLRGDTSFVARRRYGYDLSAVYTGAVYSNTWSTAYTTIVVEAMNPVDKFFDQWVQDIGRSSEELPYVIPQQKANHLRWSGVYVQDSLVNDLSSFEAFDEYPLPKENGPGTGLKKNDRLLVATHQKETTAVYIGEGFVNTSDANRFLAKTDNVVGADNKYIGGYGTYHPESIVVQADQTYFYDVFKGAIVRRATDGLFPISVYGINNLLKTLSVTYIPNRDNLKVYGGYDPRLDLCLWDFNYNGSLVFTLGFHEPTNSWIGFFDYDVEKFGRLNGMLAAFKAGELWLFNDSVNLMNFFGVQYKRYLEFNIGGSKVKTWKGIGIDTDNPYATGGGNEVVVTLTDNGTGYQVSGPGLQQSTINYLDLVKREGVWRSAIFRDVNTPQPFADATHARYEGNPMRSQMLKVQVECNRTDAAVLRSVTVLFTPSEVSY